MCVHTYTPQPASRPATAKPSDKHIHLASTHPTCPALTGRGATKRRTRNDCRHCCRQPTSTTISPVEEAHMAPNTNLGKHLIPAPRESLLGRSRKHNVPEQLHAEDDRICSATSEQAVHALAAEEDDTCIDPGSLFLAGCHCQSKNDQTQVLCTSATHKSMDAPRRAL